MANEEHLHILQQGVEAWNSWRSEHRYTKPELCEADLAVASLQEANLSWANLSRANLSRADLHEANLVWANLREANLSGADLGVANLSEANLSGADLSRAYLGSAFLARTDLIGAKLNWANLIMAFLFEVDLRSASLRGADLRRASLVNANLRGADLNWADLLWGNLSGADLHEASMNETVLADVDLSSVKGLETVRHVGPSSIGIDTLYRSGGHIPESFLRKAGVPAQLIEYIPSLVAQAIQYYSCFISHSHHDQRFCERLYSDLQTKGVRVWYFPEDAVWGRSVWGEIDRSIRIYDKLVVVCSEQSLQSRPVLREIERSLQREDEEGGHVLFPIRIDDYIFDQWQHERKADVVAKVVGDFSEWDRDVAKYDDALARLMRGLEPWREGS